MSVRKQMAALTTVVLAVAALSTTASAQCGGAGPGGSIRLTVAPTSDQGVASSSFADVDLVTRIRINMFTMFSWGRGPVAHPGTVRSSVAVLRERRGLMR